MKYRIICLLTCLLIFGLTACGGPGTDQTTESENQENMVTFTDDLGNEVSVSDPKRVAALLGSYADVWYLAGGEVIASADDAWDDFNLPMPEDAVNLGSTKRLSLEKLFAAEPDLILASTNTKIDVEWQETLNKAGIPTAYFDVSDFSDYLRMLKICTDITGRDDLYEVNGAAVKEKVDEIIKQSEERVKEKGAPKVLYLRASAGMILAKNSEGNVLGEMLKTLGCVNIADANDSLLEKVSMEYILKEDPDFIFFVPFGDDVEGMEANLKKFFEENPAWSELTAVKEGRVYHMEKSLYNLKPNEQWDAAYEKLEEILREGQK